MNQQVDFVAYPFHDKFNNLINIATNNDNYIPIPNDHERLLEAQILPICSAGDMICWDSRTIHCSTPGLNIEEYNVTQQQQQQQQSNINMNAAVDTNINTNTNINTDTRTNATHTTHNTSQLLRIASYQCMTPKTFCDTIHTDTTGTSTGTANTYTGNIGSTNTGNIGDTHTNTTTNTNTGDDNNNNVENSNTNSGNNINSTAVNSTAVNNLIQKRIQAFNYNITTTHWPHIANYTIPDGNGCAGGSVGDCNGNGNGSSNDNNSNSNISEHTIIPINDYNSMPIDIQGLIGVLDR